MQVNARHVNVPSCEILRSFDGVTKGIIAYVF